MRTPLPDDIRRILIPNSMTIAQSVRVLNDGHKRIVLVVDENDVLEGVVADSDIRRAVLASIPFQEPVSRIMVRNPVVLAADATEAEVLDTMRSRKINEIPVVDTQGRVCGLRTIDSLLDSSRDWEAVIMAGGLGSRLMPLTAQTPKPLLRVGDRAILFIILDQLIRSGCSRITISVNYLGERIVDEVSKVPKYADVVHFVRETDRMGTAGSLTLLENLPTTPFLVLNGDVLTRVNFRSMLDFHRSEENLITLAIKEETVTVPYGVVQMEETRVIGLEEKPSHNIFVNAGIYVLDPSALHFLRKGMHCDMTTLISTVIRSKQRVGSFPVHEYWRDIGKHSDLSLAQEEIGELDF